MPRGLLILVLLAVVVGAASSPARASSRDVEVLVTLEGPPVARAMASSRALTAAARSRRLDLRAPTASSYLRAVEARQARAESAIERRLPGAHVRRRLQVVLNAMSVVLPRTQLAALRGIPGVVRVDPVVRYHARLERSPAQIGAPALWGASPAVAGAGIKIGIIDDGIDQTHPFFNPTGLSYPAGFPKGQRAFTTPKVIVARAFAPRSPAWRNATKPFDAEESGHATHVAGIAAGVRGVFPAAARTTISGVAPGAWLGNYKVLTVPTASGVGLDGNSPEIAAGIEAAVRDGMDVINLSIGEPETEPSRDIVTQALDAAADAGVVPVVAAGNDFDEFGDGSIGSPGTAAKAITVAAVTTTESGRADVVAAFSSGGPTPLSLRLKPDVAAPGVAILSSVPQRDGGWAELSGTSMAAPHVSGGVALLRAQHPTWTVQQLRSALVLTGAPVSVGSAEAPATRVGGGRVDLARADAPLVFASPSAVSLGLLRPGARAALSIDVADAGGGAGTWLVARSGGDDVLRLPATVDVPGRLDVEAIAPAAAVDGERTGWIVLSRGADTRRIPFWVGLTVPTLAAPSRTLAKTGSYRGNTSGRPARVSSYRYPTGADGGRTLAGPEQVFRVRLARRAANFGVAVVSRGRGVRVEPRVVRAGDESAQVGYTSLPLNLNPYLAEFLDPALVSGAVLPAAGSYDVVFDSPTRADAGRFSFRFWVDDTRPPHLRLLTRTVRRGGTLLVAARDAGAGVDPATVHARIDGAERAARLVAGRLRLSLEGVGRGRHRLSLQVSDYQETRNMENVPAILPNTARLSATFVVR
ncbi:MAG TPA: S8 family serine peptidase [Gaiellaceae bacterium]|nr:S8 family serine peptidase [Gaiellaceae bacterium]